VVRKYIVEAESEDAARTEYEELLGAIDDDEGTVVKATAFATRQEALDSDEAYVVWKG
jgi:hypothetical protein